MSRTTGTTDLRSQARPVLLVADGSLSPRDAEWLRAAADGRSILWLDLSAAERVTLDALVARKLRIDELLQLDVFHRELIEFLDQWPRRTQVDGLPFADVFRHAGGEPLWWTGPGSLRHPFSGPLVPPLKGVWLARAACAKFQTGRILCRSRDRQLVTMLRSLAEALKCEFARLPDCARPLAPPSAMSRRRWSAAASLGLAALPVWLVIRSLYARLVTGCFRRPPAGGPALVMSGWYPNHVRPDTADRPRVVYWQPLEEALRRKRPGVRIRYLLHTTTFRFVGWKRMLRPVWTGWSRLQQMTDVLPLSQCFPELKVYFAAARRQLRLMRAYARFESTPASHSTQRFAGADVSCLLIPHLRSAVSGMARWSRTVAATARSIAAAGAVRCVLVHEEFYPKGLLTIAAARTLGLPTLGVQHGLIGPQHTVYMPPPGHVSEAPTPDLFAAYGDYAAAILSESGAYPRERIRVVGAPRLDTLVSDRGGRDAARQRLGWDASQPVLLLTTETFRLSSPVLRAVLPLAAEHPDWKVVVKLHPHEREPEAYRRLIDAAQAHTIEIYRDRLSDLLEACNVLITGYSTTAVEALLLGTPVVCADFTTSPERYPFVASGTAIGARSPDELRQALARALSDPAGGGGGGGRKEFLRRHLGPTAEGRAADVFAALIAQEFLIEP